VIKGRYSLFEIERALAEIASSAPEPENERLEELKAQYETVLGLLESHFLGAIISGDWEEFEEFVSDFKNHD
jgi:hypothetical protein